MPLDDGHMTVEELIARLQQVHPRMAVRVGLTNGKAWAKDSTPLVQVVEHVGADGEGAYCCLEVDEEWGEYR